MVGLLKVEVREEGSCEHKYKNNQERNNKKRGDNYYTLSKKNKIMNKKIKNKEKMEKKKGGTARNKGGKERMNRNPGPTPRIICVQVYTIATSALTSLRKTSSGPTQQPSISEMKLLQQKSITSNRDQNQGASGLTSPTLQTHHYRRRRETYLFFIFVGV